jgi:hypothetical protein
MGSLLYPWIQNRIQDVGDKIPGKNKDHAEKDKAQQ